MTMYRFRITLHAWAATISEGVVHQVDGVAVRTLRVPREALAEPMCLSFEEATAALMQLPRMYIEPDGCLVWVSSIEDDHKWQVDGNLYDRAGSLMFVDLSGSCPSRRFEDLLRCFGWPQAQLVFQLNQQALFLDEVEFRRFAKI
jgi:hypothetical protein